MSSIRTIENGSAPVIIAYATVSDAPMPTQTAYAVPVDMSRIAQASPPMLATSVTPKITLGQSLVNPSDLPSAVAQTASRIPDRTRMTHDMGLAATASLVAHRVLIRRPGTLFGIHDQISNPACAPPGQPGPDARSDQEHDRVEQQVHGHDVRE